MSPLAATATPATICPTVHDLYKSLYSLQPLQLSQPSVLVEVSLLIATTANNSTVCTCVKLSSTRNPYLLQPSCITVRVQVHLLSATTATVFVSVRKKSLSTLDATNATIPTSCSKVRVQVFLRRSVRANSSIWASKASLARSRERAAKPKIAQILTSRKK